MTSHTPPVSTRSRQFTPAASPAIRASGHAVRHAAVLAFVTSAGLVACSSTQVTPQTFVAAQLGASRDANNNNLCNQTSRRDVLDIGTSTGNCDPTTGVCMGTGPARVPDGATQSGAAVVHVQCQVSGNFDVTLSATLGGMRGGSISIAGHVDGSGSATNNIHSVFNIPFWDGTFSEDDCSIAPMYAGGPVPTSPAVSSGRIWAHLSCPRLVNMSMTQVKLMDGTQVQETCEGQVDFIFENCAS
ncbi:MAG: hypothetical protein M3O46_20010 [Myxococcota bacterium]|nr:hypothetical protein [Myxococcota bacterium]